MKFEDYLNLIRKIVWRFHKKSGVDWDDLFGEACIAYCRAVDTIDHKKDRDAYWVYRCVYSQLQNYCNKERRYQERIRLTGDGYNGALSYTPHYEYYAEDQLSDDVKWILRRVRRNPARYIGMNGGSPFRRITEDLKYNKGWSWERVWEAMRTLRKELNEIN